MMHLHKSFAHNKFNPLNNEFNWNSVHKKKIYKKL